MNPPPNAELVVVDSHTAGEPTRVVVQGAPFPENANPVEVRAALRAEADWVRTALTYEPRGAAWMVGAVLTPATQPDCVAGVVFFNNAGYLGMCGHGLIGVVTTLHDRGAIDYGVVRLETPAGVIKATLRPDRSVCFENVVSYRLHKSVELQVTGYGLIRGDVAYGGNWFFLARVDQVDPARLAELTDQAIQIKQSLVAHGITGEHGAEIDHVELFGPPSAGGGADSKNFVLCPGGQYDRSPCGTGTSAKVACLAADGALRPGDIWTQESILGGLFQSSYREVDGGVIPTICGRAYVTGETRVRFDPDDPHTAGF